MAFLLLLVAGMAALLAMNAGCYLWLRANEAGRTPPVRHLAAIAILGSARLGSARQKWLRGSR